MGLMNCLLSYSFTRIHSKLLCSSCTVATKNSLFILANGNIEAANYEDLVPERKTDTNIVNKSFQ